MFSTVCLSVCVFLCSDDTDTNCSKLLKASLRGTSGIFKKLVACVRVISKLEVFPASLRFFDTIMSIEHAT